MLIAMLFGPIVGVALLVVPEKEAPAVELGHGVAHLAPAVGDLDLVPPAFEVGGEVH